eukprot:scaffold42827_cov40-Phaeocystis_antarctica.AAC.4
MVRPRAPNSDSLAYHGTLCCALSVVDAARNVWASIPVVGNHWTRCASIFPASDQRDGATEFDDAVDG